MPHGPRRSARAIATLHRAASAGDEEKGRGQQRGASELHGSPPARGEQACRGSRMDPLTPEDIDRPALKSSALHSMFSAASEGILAVMTRVTDKRPRQAGVVR